MTEQTYIRILSETMDVEEMTEFLLELKLSRKEIKDLFKQASSVRGKDGKKSLLNRVKSFVKRESTDVSRMRELAGIYTLEEANYGPGMLDRLKAKAKRGIDRTKASVSNVNKERNRKDVFGARDAVTAEQLYDTWQSQGSPSDVEEIIDILKDSGFSDREIQKTFKAAGIDPTKEPDPKITKLAQAIKAAGLEPAVLKYMDEIGLKESLIFETKEVDNKAIKDMFVNFLSWYDSIEDKEAGKAGRSRMVKQKIAQGKADAEAKANESIHTDSDLLYEYFSTIQKNINVARYGRNKL